MPSPTRLLLLSDPVSASLQKGMPSPRRQLSPSFFLTCVRTAVSATTRTARFHVAQQEETGLSPGDAKIHIDKSDDSEAGNGIGGLVLAALTLSSSQHPSSQVKFQQSTPVPSVRTGVLEESWRMDTIPNHPDRPMFDRRRAGSFAIARCSIPGRSPEREGWLRRCPPANHERSGPCN